MNKALWGLSILSALSILSPSVASAEDLYAGGSFGLTDSDSSAMGASSDDNDIGLKVFAGYRAHENVAFEAFYVDLGEATATESALDEVDSFGISALGIIPVDENFELFGKVGLHSWEADKRSTFGASADADGTDPTYGIGASYTTGKVSFRAEVERYELKDDDVDMLSIGVEIDF